MKISDRMAEADHYISLPGEEVGGAKGQMVFTGYYKKIKKIKKCIAFSGLYPYYFEN